MKRIAAIAATCLLSGCVLPHSLSAFGSTGQSPVVDGWQGTPRSHHHRPDHYGVDADVDREWGWNVGLMATWTLRPQPVEVVQRRVEPVEEEE
jgi:hypothetical protein